MSREDAIRRAMEQKERGYGGDSFVDYDKLSDLGINLWKSKDGNNFIAIVPPPDLESYFAHEIFVHYKVGPAADTFLCPRMMAKKKCPLCEERLRQKENQTVSDETMKSLNPFPEKFLLWIVDMKDRDTEDEGVQLYIAPRTVHDEILALSKDRRTGEIMDISDPVDGSTLQFTRVGTDVLTKYKGFRLEERDPLDKEWVESTVDFKEVIVIHDYAYIAESYSGGEQVDGDTDESVDERRPVASRRRGRTDSGRERPSTNRRSSRRSRQDEDEVVDTDVGEILCDIGDEVDEGDDKLAESRDRLQEKLASRRRASRDTDDEPAEREERKPRDRSRRSSSRSRR